MVEDSTGRVGAVVGHTREEAARAFGLLVEDAVVTTYDDLADDVDLGVLEFLALTDGPGSTDLLERVLSSGRVPARLLVEVAEQQVARSGLADVLAAHPEIGIVGSEQLASGAAVAIGAASEGAVTGAAVTVVLDAIGSAPRTAAPLWPETGPAPRVDGSTPDVVPALPKKMKAKQAAPAGRPGLRSRLRSKRIRALLVALALGLLVVVVVLVLIGRSGLGADGVLVTLVAGVAALQALVLAGLGYLVIGSRRDRGANAEFQEHVLRRTERIVKQNLSTRNRLDRQARRSIQLVQNISRQRAQHQYVVELGRQLSKQLTHAQTAATRRHLMTERQAQALLNLRDLVEVRAAVPPTGGWAASPDLLVYCVDALLARRPATVVECGSGISTLYLALAAEQHGLDTKIVALEHQEPFAAATRALLERHGVAHRAEVRVAPLERSSVVGHETPWYAESALEGIVDIGMLLVDGPPTATGPQARYPAVPLLMDRLAPSCVIVMDDLIRVADHETADSWAAQLPDFELSIIAEFDKHVGILRRG